MDLVTIGVQRKRGLPTKVASMRSAYAEKTVRTKEKQAMFPKQLLIEWLSSTDVCSLSFHFRFLVSESSFSLFQRNPETPVLLTGQRQLL